jgi:hypothetical protein
MATLVLALSDLTEPSANSVLTAPDAWADCNGLFPPIPVFARVESLLIA